MERKEVGHRDGKIESEEKAKKKKKEEENDSKRINGG